jgi:hypothetical protein
MKNIIVKQIIFIPILYIVTKLLWDVIPINFLPEILKGVVSDLFGPSFLMALVLWVLFFFIWKFPILEKPVQYLFGTKPNIQGTWRGILKYEYEGKKMEKVVFLVIKQPDGYSMHIWLLTNERTSSSKFVDIVSYGGRQQIVYTYSNEESPDNKEKNPSHEGFCQLKMIDKTNILQGIYYTSRRTFGELRFDKKNRKVINDFEKAQKLFGI